MYIMAAQRAANVADRDAAYAEAARIQQQNSNDAMTLQKMQDEISGGDVLAAGGSVLGNIGAAFAGGAASSAFGTASSGLAGNKSQRPMNMGPETQMGFGAPPPGYYPMGDYWNPRGSGNGGFG
jgi:hypothetical protein